MSLGNGGMNRQCVHLSHNGAWSRVLPYCQHGFFHAAGKASPASVAGVDKKRKKHRAMAGYMAILGAFLARYGRFLSLFC